MPMPAKSSDSPQQGGVPQTWIEWIFSRFDPNQWVIQYQQYTKILQVPAGATVGDDITFAEPMFVFSVRSYGFIASGAGAGSVPTMPYRIGFKNQNGNAWTGTTNVAAAIVTGDLAAKVAAFRDDWLLPREVAARELVTITVDNSLNAAQVLTVDVAICGYEIRRRSAA